MQEDGWNVPSTNSEHAAPPRIRFACAACSVRRFQFAVENVVLNSAPAAGARPVLTFSLRAVMEASHLMIRAAEQNVSVITDLPRFLPKVCSMFLTVAAGLPPTGTYACELASKYSTTTCYFILHAIRAQVFDVAVQLASAFSIGKCKGCTDGLDGAELTLFRDLVEVTNEADLMRLPNSVHQVLRLPVVPAIQQIERFMVLCAHGTDKRMQRVAQVCPSSIAKLCIFAKKSALQSMSIAVLRTTSYSLI